MISRHKKTGLDKPRFFVPVILSASHDAHKGAAVGAELERFGCQYVVLRIGAEIVSVNQEVVSAALEAECLGHVCYLA